MEEDLKNILLTVLELISFKNRDFFFSKKHEMVKFDLARQFIFSTEYIGHLSSEFLLLLQELASDQIHSCKELMFKLR